MYGKDFSCSSFFEKLAVTGAASVGYSYASVPDMDYELTILKDGQTVGIIRGVDITRLGPGLPIGTIGEERVHPSFFPDISMEQNYGLMRNLNFDSDLMEKRIRELEFVSVLPDHPFPVVRISMDQDGKYELEDNHDTIKDKKKLIIYIKEAIEEGEETLELSDLDYDLDVPYTDEQLETIEFFKEVDKIQNAQIILEDMGKELILKDADIADLLVSNDGSSPLMGTDGKPVLSEAKLDDICTGIADDFTTRDSTFWWKKYNGGTVSFNHVKYGVVVDKDKTFDLLKDTITDGRTYTGTPVYTDESKDDRIGDTYVEVDMSAQHMYFFKDGNLVLDSDVVTGNKARHNDTPETIEPIYFMQRNRVLVGENYRTPVKYWMAFHNHVGLHDANWRSKFGGEIYKTDGSHGCVNLPTETAAELYEYVTVGTPVITYY
ncbi:MAG: L,D-transpeptidase [Lachnospiraceae bacterium]|nr:L,D-transpeptidase [Lachnospiraceae bacterium]